MANRQRLRTVAQGRLGVVKNVSYTPGIKKLLSERSLIKQGYGIVKLSLQHADIICRTTGKLKGRAYSTNNGLWMIDPLTIKPLDDEVIAKHPEYAMTSSLKDEDAFDHYQNIMFMPQNAMKQLKEQRAVEGFKVSMKSLNKKRPLNTALILGSMTRNPVRRKKMMKQKPPIGHTIIADVYGKVRTKGLNGQHYYAFFIDKGGGMNGVYAMKTKDEMSEKIQKYFSFKNSIGENIKVFESDGGTEIQNKKIKSWLRDKGVHVNVGAPYKHEHTAAINPQIRYTMDLARSMMIFAKDKPLGFHPNLHPWAVMHANYIRNRTRLVERDGQYKTRYEWSMHRKPDLSKLCYWGCIGYQRIPDEVRNDKQSDKARIGYFMGFDTDGKGTLVYIPAHKKVVSTGDFIFDELSTRTDIQEAIKFEKKFLDTMESDESDESTVDEMTSDAPPSEKIVIVEDRDRRSIPDENLKRNPDTIASRTRRYKNWNESNVANMAEIRDKIDENFDINDIIINDDNSDDNMIKRAWIDYINAAIDYLNGAEVMTLSNEELLNGPDGKLWAEANCKEYSSFKSKNVFKLVKKPPGQMIHKCKIVNVIKTNLDGSKKYKTRCVIAGWSLRKGIDYKETFSPTVRQDSLKVVLALAVQQHLMIHHLDYETAYLNSPITEDVYMEIPSGYDIREEAEKLGFDPHDPNLCLKLNKSLYGTPQAGRNWNRDVHSHILSLGFKSFTKDPCIYFKKNANGNPIIICLYVDDVLICSREDEYLSKLKKDLNNRYKLNDMGRVTKFLGLNFRQVPDRLELSLTDFIDKILTKFNMIDCNISDTPAVTSVILSKAQCPSTEEEKARMSHIPYRELIGSLLFACCTIVPEITAIVSKLAEFMQNPGFAHWTEAKRVLRYLKGIKHEKFIFRRGEGPKTFQLYGYVDADWAADRDNRRSRAGYVFKIGQCIVSWASILEPTVALSTAESELMAATLATKQAVFLRDLLAFLHKTQLEPTILLEDNDACLKLSRNPEFHKRTKHIDIRWFFVREKFLTKEVVLTKVKSKNNIADLFTKVLPLSSFNHLLSALYEYH